MVTKGLRIQAQFLGHRPRVCQRRRIHALPFERRGKWRLRRLGRQSYRERFNPGSRTFPATETIWLTNMPDITSLAASDLTRIQSF